MNSSKLLIGLLGLSVTLSVGSTAHASDDIPFKYECEYCPANWGNLVNPIYPDVKLYPLCSTGEIQSPVAVNRADAYRTDLPYFTIDTIATPYEIKVMNTNYEFFPKESGQIITLGGVEYNFSQFHFHTSSEHLLDGESFPLEAHFVHKSDDGKLAVFAVLFKEGDSELPGLDWLLKVLEEKVAIADPGDSVDFDMFFDLRVLLPQDNWNKTLRYTGSTTTPPCIEAVQWIINTKYNVMTEDQLSVIRDIILKLNNGFGNNRPIQPLNGRKVYIDDFDDDDNGDG